MTSRLNFCFFLFFSAVSRPPKCSGDVPQCVCQNRVSAQWRSSVRLTWKACPIKKNSQHRHPSNTLKTTDLPWSTETRKTHAAKANQETTEQAKKPTNTQRRARQPQQANLSIMPALFSASSFPHSTLHTPNPPTVP